jgi:hypothetical protein
MRGGGAPSGAKGGVCRDPLHRNAGKLQPRNALRARHRDVFLAEGPFFRVKGRAPHSAYPDDFAPFTNTTSSQHEWQSPVVGPDGDPKPPECAGYVTPHPQAPHPVPPQDAS